MAEKLVEITVKEDGKVHDGKGNFFAEGDKVKVSEDTAKSLKAKKLA